VLQDVPGKRDAGKESHTVHTPLNPETSRQVLIRRAMYDCNVRFKSIIFFNNAQALLLRFERLFPVNLHAAYSFLAPNLRMYLSAAEHKVLGQK